MANEKQPVVRARRTKNIPSLPETYPVVILDITDNILFEDFWSPPKSIPKQLWFRISHESSEIPKEKMIMDYHVFSIYMDSVLKYMKTLSKNNEVYERYIRNAAADFSRLKYSLNRYYGYAMEDMDIETDIDVPNCNEISLTLHSHLINECFGLLKNKKMDPTSLKNSMNILRGHFYNSVIFSKCLIKGILSAEQLMIGTGSYHDECFIDSFSYGFICGGGKGEISNIIISIDISKLSVAEKFFTDFMTHLSSFYPYDRAYRKTGNKKTFDIRVHGKYEKLVRDTKMFLNEKMKYKGKKLFLYNIILDDSDIVKPVYLIESGRRKFMTHEMNIGKILRFMENETIITKFISI